MAAGIVFDVKEMSVNDGPGIRTTVFLKGCPLRCNWCHNPEGLSPSPQLKQSGLPCLGCGKCTARCGHEQCAPFGRCLRACPQGRLSACGQTAEPAALAASIKRLSELLVASGGGVTISGGEPLMQPDFLLELTDALKPLHVAVETSAHGPKAVFCAVLERTDLIIADIKHMDDGLHKTYTGVGNEQILSNLTVLKQSGRPFIIRVPLIPGVNDDRENLSRTAQFLADAKALLRVELLPYNPLAGAKYKAVGLEYAPRFDVQARPNISREVFDSLNIPCEVL
jgi:pyruvate formate lyase activating enzyme